MCSCRANPHCGQVTTASNSIFMLIVSRSGAIKYAHCPAAARTSTRVPTGQHSIRASRRSAYSGGHRILCEQTDVEQQLRLVEGIDRFERVRFIAGRLEGQGKGIRLVEG